MEDPVSEPLPTSREGRTREVLLVMVEHLHLGCLGC